MSKSRKAKKNERKDALSGLYEKLGITSEVLALHQMAMNESDGTAFCPFTFTSDTEEPLLCELDNGHPGNHKASMHTPEGHYHFEWPRCRDDRACEDYLRRAYDQYMPLDDDALPMHLA